MKKIFYRLIEKDSQTFGNSYEVAGESTECEYSEVWFDGSCGDDPIKEYVKNATENLIHDGSSFESLGYAWDCSEEEISINFGSLCIPGAYHILFQNGTPIEIYYVGESDEETEE